MSTTVCSPILKSNCEKITHHRPDHTRHTRCRWCQNVSLRHRLLPAPLPLLLHRLTKLVKRLARYLALVIIGNKRHRPPLSRLLLHGPLVRHHKPLHLAIQRLLLRLPRHRRRRQWVAKTTALGFKVWTRLQCLLYKPRCLQFIHSSPRCLHWLCRRDGDTCISISLLIYHPAYNCTNLHSHGQHLYPHHSTCIICVEDAFCDSLLVNLIV